MEKEKRRQQLEKRKQMRKRRMYYRMGVAGMAIVLVGGVIWGISHRQKNIDLPTSGKVQESTEGESLPPLDENEKYEALTVEDLSKGNLVLVNDSCPLNGYDDTELKTIGDVAKGVYLVKSKDLKLKEEALDALNKMMTDFKKEKGDNDLIVVSCYRSYEDQEVLHYQSVVEKQEVTEETDTFIARPDRSEHHTGLAVDFNIYRQDGTSEAYDGTGIYSWINENCYKYGFVQRYAEDKKEKTGIGNEPWHFRYVGAVHANYMKEQNLCLEEYIQFLKSFKYYTNPLHTKSGIGSRYSIYYVAATGELTHVPVPTNKPYTVSGNNRDGFIVTVQLNKENNVN